MKKLSKILPSLLRDLANKIEDDTCELTDAQVEYFLSLLTARSYSKEEACAKLHMSRSTFDKLVALGKIPQGVKKRGFKELVWHSYDLDKYIKSLKKS